MADYGILFSAPMVRALLDGRKTQTRRLASSPLAKRKKGDRLWVRETWQAGMGCDGPQITYRATPDYFDLPYWDGPDYGAGPSFNYDHCPGSDFSENLADVISGDGPWRPSIFMPRWASRILLEIVDVRFQRLCEITREDAISEGLKLHKTYQGARGPIEAWCVDHPQKGVGHPVEIFAGLWDELHAKSGERWRDNPQIVALTFRILKTEVGDG